MLIYIISTIPFILSALITRPKVYRFGLREKPKETKETKETKKRKKEKRKEEKRKEEKRKEKKRK